MGRDRSRRMVRGCVSRGKNLVWILWGRSWYGWRRPSTMKDFCSLSPGLLQYLQAFWDDRGEFGIGKEIGRLSIVSREPHFCSCKDLICKTVELLLIPQKKKKIPGWQPEWNQGAYPLIQLHYVKSASSYQREGLQLRGKSKGKNQNVFFSYVFRNFLEHLPSVQPWLCW